MMKKLTHNQAMLVYWINERDLIRRKKEAGGVKPWSVNPVMQETYFCNVNREDDKVTRWIRQNWTYSGDHKEAYTIAMMAARLFNLPSTLEAIQQVLGGVYEFPYWLEHIEETLRPVRERGDKIWNGAYIVSTNGKKMDKLTYCIELLGKAGKHLDIIDDCTTLAEAHKKLMTIEGLASFLAAQIIADLKNSEGHPLSKAPDWMTFSAFGPGSLRGLSWFWEKDIRPNVYKSYISDAYDLIYPHLDSDVQFALCMQNLQNCFCEYDKFMRVTNKTGRSKREYPGGK